MTTQETLTKTAESFRQQAMALAADMETLRQHRDELWALVQMMRTSLILGASGKPVSEAHTTAIILELCRFKKLAQEQGWSHD